MTEVGQRAQIAFGCAALAGLYAPVSADEAHDVLAAAWDAGIRRFDTAPFYGLGLSERRVGDFLRSRPRADFTLSSKVGRLLEPLKGDVPDPPLGHLRNGVRYDYSHDGILRSHEKSLARLGLDRIDILYVHDIGEFAHGPEANARHMKDLTGSGLKALERLKSEGAIDGFGLGVNETEVCLELMKHAHFDEILLAGRYTLLDRSAEAALLPRAQTAGTRLVIGGVFNSGILATGPGPDAHFNYEPATPEIKEKVAAIAEIAGRYGLALPEAAINFPADHPCVSHILIGTGKRSSLMRNLKQFGRALPQELLNEIKPFTIR
ncbi:aldo/keto reductase [Martelella radicis]|uniref:D-threo-aldose 1-dehydrogenase n=1 Tax=Martelella radicis TaxID=1397476 RepID=A0A7W6KJS5_9HYPH|nr:aldo/keto reductase [Martelella radicis]MBB4122624.1 D-threo-aldose 1-dehydrogenase [Martelella radicis]